MAQWLDTVWLDFDYAILQAIHNFAVLMGGENGIFTWFMRFISLLGEEGIGLILLGIGLSLFKRTRKAGFCVLLALACGGVITNITLKNLITRTRPFRREDVQAFAEWWQYIGSTHAGQRSFPSGHTTSAVAAMTALFLTLPKKYSWTAFLFAALTALSRMYLVVHYPTDILGGILAGALAAVGGYWLTRLVLRLLDRYGARPVAKAVAEFDLAALICSRRKKAAENAVTPQTVCEKAENEAEDGGNGVDG